MPALLLGFLSVASGASFDCAKASTKTEKLICTNPKLSKLDEDMAAAYKRMRSGLSKKEKKDILQSQKYWLRYWPALCLKQPNALECAQKSYKDRIEELKIETGYLEAFTKYNVHLHSALPSEYADEYFKTATCHMSYPVLNNPQTDSTISSINAWLIPQNETIQDCLKDNESDAEHHISLGRTSPNILSSLEHLYFMGHGAAHPNSVSTHSYFHVAQKRKLKPEDIFTDIQWRSVAAAYVYKALLDELQDMIQTDPKDVAKQISTTDLWQITPTSLNIQFNNYDVAPYVSGPQEVQIPWSKLKPYLSPFAKKELGL